MSRRSVQFKGHTVVVGWDPPLGTFFGQVYAPEPEGLCQDVRCELRPYKNPHLLQDCQDNNPKLWVGMTDRVGTVDALIRRLGEWGDALDPQTKLALEADRRANRGA